MKRKWTDYLAGLEIKCMIDTNSEAGTIADWFSFNNYYLVPKI